MIEIVFSFIIWFMSPALRVFSKFKDPSLLYIPARTGICQMGTESEALRWKQWIDRWIKISAPESAQSISSSVSSSKVDAASSTSGHQHRKSLLTTEQLRYQLVNMVKEGDPVFCEGLCRELLNNVSHFRLAIKCLTGVETSEKARGFFCQIIFYLCKCPSPSVRKFLLSLLPALLFSHLILYSSENNNENDSKTVDDGDEEEEVTELNSIEIALLALYQADMNYQPEPLTVRVPSLQTNSLYHTSMKQTDIFPFNVNPSLIQPPSHLYPTSPILKVTDYTRCIVYYRLCRSFQDFMPTMPDLTLVLYSFWIERCAVGGTVLEDLEALDALFLKQISNSEDLQTRQQQSVSMLASASLNTLSTSHSSYYIQASASTRNIEAEDWEFIKALVLKAVSLRIRTRANEDLMLLWTDCVTFVLARYVSLGDLLRKRILSRARMELLPQVLMALE